MALHTFNTRRRGLTLAESLLAASVLAVGVIGIATSISVSSQQTRVAEDEATASTLARQLMEEISAKPFLDPDTNLRTSGANEANRSQYDNIGDYHNYSDSTASLTTASGISILSSSSKVFQRKVTVDYRAAPGDTATNANGNYAVVTVTITLPGGATRSFSQVFCNVKAY
jgi:Tfp pilus assembly protein PilV